MGVISLRAMRKRALPTGQAHDPCHSTPSIFFSHLLVLVAHDGKQIEHVGGDSDAMCDQTLFKKSVKN
jgi:hypothetical protein